MTTGPASLASQTRQLNDEELLSRYAYTTLSDEERSIARSEIDRRGLTLPRPHAARIPASAEAGDYEIVARYLDPTAAHLACSTLESARIPALVADAELVQTNALWAIALGGARLLVPARYLDEAKAIIAATERGDFALADDDDMGHPSSS